MQVFKRANLENTNKSKLGIKVPLQNSGTCIVKTKPWYVLSASRCIYLLSFHCKEVLILSIVTVLLTVVPLQKKIHILCTSK